MKRTIAITLIISLVMCLFMAFPANADSIVLGQGDALNLAINYTGYLADYPYRAYFYSHSFDLSRKPCVVVYCFKTPAPVHGSPFVQYFFESDKYSGAGLGSTYRWGNSYVYGNTNDAMKLVNSSDSGNNYVWYRYVSIYFEYVSTAKLDFIPPQYVGVADGYVDVSFLQLLLSQAKAIQNTGYTQSTWNALQSQISAVETLLTSSGYTQEQIDNAKNALQAALDGLVILPDTSELQALLTVADTIQNDGYSKSTWNPFVSARSLSHALIASSFYTASDVSNSRNTLQTTMDNLTLLPDSSFLEILIEQAQMYIDDKYTELSLQILNSKIMQAILLLEDKDFVSAQIDQMILDLQDAILNLVLLSPEEPEPPTPPPIIIDSEYMWELNSEQKKYANLIDGVRPDHLNPVKEAVEDNMAVARGYGFWIWFLVLVPLILIIITRGFLRDIGSNISLDMTHKDTGHIRLTAKKVNRRGDDVF